VYDFLFFFWGGSCFASCCIGINTHVGLSKKKYYSGIIDEVQSSSFASVNSMLIIIEC